MRIRAIFSLAYEHVVSWPKKVENFPKLLKYKGKVYEFTMYSPSKAFSGADYDCYFAEIEYSYGRTYNWETPVDFDVLLYPEGKHSCQCGAHKLGYKNRTRHHSFWCPMYEDPEKD